MSANNSILEHDCPSPLTGVQRSAFINYLARVFRMPPASIEPLVNCEMTANGIWQSLKGLTGVTAKCIPSNISSGDALRGTQGVKMGGIAIIAAAHCPQVDTWLSRTEFKNGPGNVILSPKKENSQFESNLWDKLHAFAKKTIPNIRDPHNSNIKSVLLTSCSVVILLDSERFDPVGFSTRLKQNDGGGACLPFRELKEFLAQDISKTTLEWCPDKCAFTFQTKSI